MKIYYQYYHSRVNHVGDDGQCGADNSHSCLVAFLNFSHLICWDVERKCQHE